MSALLEHVWGVSPAQDRVWAQVAGIGPSKAGSRVFVVLQAFIDDSYDIEGVFVLGGYVASAESWAVFSGEWEQMLPHGTLHPKRNKYHFKMSEMAMTEDRMKRVPGFFRIIEKHALMAVSCKIDIAQLKKARGRIWVPDLVIDWGFIESPFRFATRCLLDHFHNHRPKLESVIPLDQTVDFYFDETSEKTEIRVAWDDYMKTRDPEVRGFYGNEPRFEDDMAFLPLQAADFWAWWVRKWYAEGAPEKIASCDFGTWKMERDDLVRAAITLSEDDIVDFLKSALAETIEPGRPIFDRKFSEERSS